MTAVYDVVLSPSYAVPVLYITVSVADGEGDGGGAGTSKVSSIGMEEMYEVLVPRAYRAQLSKGMGGDGDGGVAGLGALTMGVSFISLQGTGWAFLFIS